MPRTGHYQQKPKKRRFQLSFHWRRRVEIPRQTPGLHWQLTASMDVDWCCTARRPRADLVGKHSCCCCCCCCCWTNWSQMTRIAGMLPWKWTTHGLHRKMTAPCPQQQINVMIEELVIRVVGGSVSENLAILRSHLPPHFAVHLSKSHAGFLRRQEVVARDCLLACFLLLALLTVCLAFSIHSFQLSKRPHCCICQEYLCKSLCGRLNRGNL